LKFVAGIFIEAVLSYEIVKRYYASVDIATSYFADIIYRAVS